MKPNRIIKFILISVIAFGLLTSCSNAELYYPDEQDESNQTDTVMNDIYDDNPEVLCGNEVEQAKNVSVDAARTPVERERARTALEEEANLYAKKLLETGETREILAVNLFTEDASYTFTFKYINSEGVKVETLN